MTLENPHQNVQMSRENPDQNVQKTRADQTSWSSTFPHVASRIFLPYLIYILVKHNCSPYL